MFGISFPELLIIFVVLLLVVGPDKLPEIAAKLGKIMGDLKRSSDSVRREFYNSVYTPAKQIRSEVTRELKTAKSIIDEPVKTTNLNSNNDSDKNQKSEEVKK